MKPSIKLSVSDVQAILAAALDEARKNEWRVSVVVADAGGHPLALLRDDGAMPLASEIATGKAKTAAISGRPSKFFEQVVKDGRVAFLSVPAITFLEGGLPILVDGQCIGAIGVSGARSDQDSQIAEAALRAFVDAPPA